LILAHPSLPSHEPGTRIGVGRVDWMCDPSGRQDRAVTPKRRCLVAAAERVNTGPWESKAFLISQIAVHSTW
jgi:hypothetical protein